MNENEDPHSHLIRADRGPAVEAYDRWYYTTTTAAPSGESVPVGTTLLLTEEDTVKLEVLEMAFMAGRASIDGHARASFVTGSQAYGAPRTTSDIDLVIRACPSTAAFLKERSDQPDVRTVMFGKLNLIVCTTEEEYEAWLEATLALVDESQEHGPVNKMRAIHVMNGYRKARGLEESAVSGGEEPIRYVPVDETSLAALLYYARKHVDQLGPPVAGERSDQQLFAEILGAYSDTVPDVERSSAKTDTMVEQLRRWADELDEANLGAAHNVIQAMRDTAERLDVPF